MTWGQCGSQHVWCLPGSLGLKGRSVRKLQPPECSRGLCSVVLRTGRSGRREDEMREEEQGHRLLEISKPKRQERNIGAHGMEDTQAARNAEL